VLWEKDAVSVKAIGERLHLDSGTLTPLLKRLEASGYVRRSRDTEDERHLRVELTDKGRDLRGRIGVARESVVCALGGSEEPIQNLRAELQKITPLLRGV
jgi:DNA-binding MarR family transcriptional regulator